MSALFAVARADFRERTRTFAMVVIVAAALQFGYLFVPDANASYATIDLGGWRGIYDSAWMGAATALLTIAEIPLIAFFLVRPALTRDARLGTFEVVAAAPLRRVVVVLGKWLSNVALLATLAAILVGAAIVMQFVRGEDRAIHVESYLLPYLLLSVPACCVMAAYAIVIDAVPPLRGVLGAIAAMVTLTLLIALPVERTHGRGVAPFDPLGVTTISAGMFSSLRAAAPAANPKGDFSVGFSPRAKHVFRFRGIAWPAASLAMRGVWVAASMALVALVSRFALAAPRPAKRRGLSSALPARLASALPVGRLQRVELVSAFGAAGLWWLCGAATLTALAVLLDAEWLARAIAPLVWIWPVGVIGALSVTEARAQFDGVLRAMPTPAWRRIGARWLACVAIAIVPVFALAVRDGAGGIALIAVAGAAAAVAVALGTVTRSAVAFEGFAIAAWYAGPVNRIPAFDPSAASAHPIPVTMAAFVVTAAALGAAAWRSAARD